MPSSVFQSGVKYKACSKHESFLSDCLKINKGKLKFVVSLPDLDLISAASMKASCSLCLLSELEVKGLFWSHFCSQLTEDEDSSFPFTRRK